MTDQFGSQLTAVFSPDGVVGSSRSTVTLHATLHAMLIERSLVRFWLGRTHFFGSCHFSFYYILPSTYQFSCMHMPVLFSFSSYG